MVQVKIILLFFNIEGSDLLQLIFYSALIGTGLRNRSNSLSQMDGQQLRGSAVAWPDKRQRYLKI